jgi:hypothetical protein
MSCGEDRSLWLTVCYRFHVFACSDVATKLPSGRALPPLFEFTQTGTLYSIQTVSFPGREHDFLLARIANQPSYQRIAGARTCTHGNQLAPSQRSWRFVIDRGERRSATNRAAWLQQWHRAYVVMGALILAPRAGKCGGGGASSWRPPAAGGFAANNQQPTDC